MLPIQSFIKRESAGGLLLISTALLAMLMANSPLDHIYDLLLSTPVAIQIGEFALHKPLLTWINDGLMAVFFFLIGLEIKQELVEGELSSREKAALPIIAALGGMLVPALIYAYLNRDDPVALHGWGIPVATDIAFALGILMLLGEHAPRGLKTILLSLAIIDDIGAILIIALFYTHDVSLLAFLLSLAAFGAAVGLNRSGVYQTAPYIWLGVFMWLCLLKSGVHATLAGVMLAMTIPLHVKSQVTPPLQHLKYKLHPWVSYGIIPVFVFANAGVSLEGVSLELFDDSVPLGIATGLFLGKQLGVFSFVALCAALGLCKLPQGVTWPQFYGLAVLTGIGFTMSLFIGTLAFDDPLQGAQIRLAVLFASLLSAVVGYCILRSLTKEVHEKQHIKPA